MTGRCMLAASEGSIRLQGGTSIHTEHVPVLRSALGLVLLDWNQGNASCPQATAGLDVPVAL